ncbi:MAG TPA: cysteine dioxygenase family protein [Pseudonocardiaceae bacterium]|nr:cysteine dioxygenase family protein [Pseudonocardiaceae bacterium]
MPSLVIRRFVDNLTLLSEGTPDPARLAVRVGSLLESVLGVEHVLEAAEREPDPNRYRQHILHVDPAGRFSVVALVWLPGQATPIHDHLAWCVAGILTGREREHRFDRMPGRRPALRASATVCNEVGDVSVLTAGPDIHQVSCAGGGRTISLHVYGADITARGTSVNLTYRPALVTAAPPAGRPSAA